MFVVTLQIMIKSACFINFFCSLALLTSLKELKAQEQPIRIEGYTQGTTYHISYYDSLNRDLQPEIEVLLNKFDQSVSTYNPNSIISKINTNQPNVVLDSYFITCFKKAKLIWKSTNGAFDPTVYPLVNLWGFGPLNNKTIDKSKIDSIKKFVGFHLIEIKNNKIIKKDKRVCLDFNAFAQGYSVDVIAQFLESKKINSYVVEIGGEVFAKGHKPNGEYWKIGIEKPMDNHDSANPIKAIATLNNMALATSGNYRKFFIENGQRYAHHIDPKTGYPAKNNLLSASVFSSDCITSDAHATGILVMGLEKAIAFLSQHPELQAYLIYADDSTPSGYKVFETPQIKSIVTELE